MISEAPTGGILLTGGSGLLGGAIRRLRPSVVAPPREALDVTQADGVEAALGRFIPDIVVHAAAVVGARECEADVGQCVAVNVGGTLAVAEACRRRDVRLVYVSSDYVFDGRRGGYCEEDSVNPTTTYGRTKLAGELIALTVPGALAVRTSFHSEGRWRFAGAFVDQFTSRLPVGEAAAQLLRAAESPLTGVIHIGGPRRSLYDIAVASQPDVAPIRLADTDLPLPRDVSLDSARWRAFCAGRTPVG